MQEKELTVVLWIGGVLFTFIGCLIGVAGRLSYDMFKQHREDNDCAHSEIKDDLEAVRTKVDDEIVRVHKRIDDVLIGE